jgi:hypothetical protein
MFGTTNKENDLSSGIGLALLSKAMGANNIENRYLKHINNIRKTRLIGKLEMRERVQRKIRDDVSRLTHQTDYDVSRMYWRSKKNVYGIDNELHLVEQVQKCLRYLFKDYIDGNIRIGHQEI